MFLDSPIRISHPCVPDLVNQLMERRLPQSDRRMESWLEVGGWPRHFDHNPERAQPSLTTTAEVCCALLASCHSLGEGRTKEIGEAIGPTVGEALNHAGMRKVEGNHLHNFVRPLEAYALYVKHFGRLQGDVDMVSRLAERIRSFCPNPKECFRMRVSDIERVDITEIFISTDWEKPTDDYNDLLAAGWLGLVGDTALCALAEEGVVAEDEAVWFKDRLMKTQSTLFTLTTLGIRKSHPGAMMYFLALVSMARSNLIQKGVSSEEEEDIKRICRSKSFVKEVIAAETVARERSEYVAPLLPLLCLSLVRLSDLECVWEILPVAAGNLLNGRVRRGESGFYEVVGAGRSKVNQVYTWAHTLRGVAEFELPYFSIVSLERCREAVKEAQDKKERCEKELKSARARGGTLDGLSWGKITGDWWLAISDKVAVLYVIASGVGLTALIAVGPLADEFWPEFLKDVEPSFSNVLLASIGGVGSISILYRYLRRAGMTALMATIRTAELLFLFFSLGGLLVLFIENMLA